MGCALWMCHKEGTEEGNTSWSGDCTPTKVWSGTGDGLLNNDEETEVQKGDHACHTHLLVKKKVEYNIYFHVHIMFFSHPTL